jgi:dissimilatory sulfite reductase (desulfoviridin) alpha/beta subunit
MTYRKECNDDCKSDKLSLQQLISIAILDFDCPECLGMDRCIDSLECRLYAQGRKDAAAIVLGQQSTPILPGDAN